jgi:Uncharacterized protein conserved in bacteria (DUF2252)
MMASPFAFYRGSPAIMAADLSRTPSTGFQLQICGDAHLDNFGTFATPERNQVFDLNDFDETQPGPGRGPTPGREGFDRPAKRSQAAQQRYDGRDDVPHLPSARHHAPGRLVDPGGDREDFR